MQKLKQADIFPTDTQFTLMGLSSISSWKTKLFSLLVLLLSLAASLPTAKHMWSPLSSLPITTRLISSDLLLDPFILAINYTEESDLGKAGFWYLGGRLGRVECPAGIAGRTAECWRTPRVNFTQGNITMRGDVEGFYEVYVQVFSLGYALGEEKREMGFEKVGYWGGVAAVVRLGKVRLEVGDTGVGGGEGEGRMVTLPRVDSVVTGLKPSSGQGEKQLFSIASLAAGVTSPSQPSDPPSPTPQIVSIFCASPSPTSLQYQITRTTLLSALSIFISYLKTFSSISSLIIIINVFAVKSYISSELYESRYNGNYRVGRWKSVRLWVFDVVSGGRWVEKRLEGWGWFKEERELGKAYREVDEKRGLESIFRVIAVVEEGKNGEGNGSGEQSKVASQQPPNHEIPSPNPSPLLSIDLNYNFSPQVHYTPYSPLSTLLPPPSPRLPLLSSFVLHTLLPAVNMNPRPITLLSDRSQKSSFFSIFVTCLGVLGIVLGLGYLGGFSQGERVVMERRLVQEAEFEVGGGMGLYVRVGGGEEMAGGERGEVRFVVFDERGGVVVSQVGYPNCTDTLDEPIPNVYCVTAPLTLRCNTETNLNHKLAILFTPPPSPSHLFPPYTLQLSFLNSLLLPSKILPSLQRLTLRPLPPHPFQTLKLTPLQQDRNGQISHFYSISEGSSGGGYDGVLGGGSGGGFVVELEREVGVLKVRDGGGVGWLRGVWSVGVGLFTVLVTFVIFPYNSRVARGSVMSKVKRGREREEGTGDRESREKTVFSMENMMRALYSKYYSMKPRTPFAKKLLR